MDDETKDGYQALREFSSQRRAARRGTEKTAIWRLERLGYTVRALSPYHFRINGVLDVWPTNRRFHSIRDGERGGYTDVELLVRAHLGEAKERRG